MPRVTVITPNYNHARFLPRRIESILDQTFRDFEFIILDNASTDDSREVIESYASSDPRIKAIFNPENNGNPFRQWGLGLGQAKGEFVWIAESDDFADPSLLETLVDRLDRHPGVGLAMCQTWMVDQDGNIIDNYIDRLRTHQHNCTFDLSRWSEDFMCDGRDYCAKHLSLRSTIPNASGVLFRRSTLEAAGGAPTYMSYLGDYMTYVKVLLISDIAFVSKSLNYFRQHTETTRGRLQAGDEWIRELRMVQRVLTDRVGVPERDKNFREILPGHVAYIIGTARRPPSGKVPLRAAPGLLIRFARLDPRAFAIALRMLAKEGAASLIRSLGLLHIARRLKDVASPENTNRPT
jgi:glycosyltransferase involved in cell wall biosynthesis